MTLIPNFLIVGAQKSGTTSLVISLRSHPEVFMARPKEIHYFDWHWDKGEDWYISHFKAGEGFRAVGEASPSYLYHPEVHARMANLIPKARLIAIIRDPVERAYSHYWFNRALRAEKLEFEEALRAEPSRMTNARSLRERARFAYLDRGRYLKQFRSLCKYYPRSALLIVTLNELGSDPVGLFDSLARFLEIGPEPPENLDLPKHGYRYSRWIRLNHVISRIPLRMRRPFRAVNIASTAYPPLDARLRERLVDQFAEDNAALAKWLGKDLSMWN